MKYQCQLGHGVSQQTTLSFTKGDRKESDAKKKYYPGIFDQVKEFIK